MVPEGSWEMAAVRTAPGQAREHVRDLAGLVGYPEDRLGDLLLCVSEAVTNALVHAYRDDADPGRIQVDARVEDESFVVSVRDDGTGMLPRPDSPGLGLGMPIIAALSRSMDIRQMEGGGTEIVMRFSLA